MTLFDKRKEKLIARLKNKEYRDAFVSEHIATGIPFQIRALREQEERKWSQQELGKRAGMLQERISVLEDPDYGKFTIVTLKKLASAFDIGIVVRFVPISELVEWDLNLSSESLKVLSFKDEPYFKEKKAEAGLEIKSNIQGGLKQNYGIGIPDLSEWRRKKAESAISNLLISGQPSKETKTGGARA